MWIFLKQAPRYPYESIPMVWKHERKRDEWAVCDSLQVDRKNI
jgi:hypothetical protein